MCSRCAAVVCCRVSPNQKAEVVSLVKSKQGAHTITLAIGDGANDCAMIKAAHVGIGISGLEGLQAVMASDISIAQFRFLVPLLLVHGHWSYERISKMILYSFYKNIAIAMTSIWFAVSSGFSAQLFYDAYAGSVFNIIFTSMPPLLIAMLDRDVSRENLLKYPQLYASGLRNECFNVRLLLRIVGEGVAHSLLLYYSCYCLYNRGGDVMSTEGRSSDLWVFSTAMFTYLVVVVNMRMALDMSTFTWLNIFFLVASVLAWFGFALLYCGLGLVADMLMVAQQMMSTAAFWMGLLVIPVMCVVPEVAWLTARRTFWPTPKDIVMEMERGYGANEADKALLPTRHSEESDTPPRLSGYGATSSVPADGLLVRATSTQHVVAAPAAAGSSASASRRPSARPSLFVGNSSSRLLPPIGGAGSHQLTITSSSKLGANEVGDDLFF